MTRWIRRAKLTRYAVWAAVVAVSAALLQSDVHGFGIAQVINSKSLPDATIDVIDPESGTSSGTMGSDVNIAVGDIILFRFAFAPVPDKSTRSIQSYLTEYLPPNTELVGVRIIDENGRTIKPRPPGISKDGCESSGGRCTTFDGVPCNGGTCNFAGGAIAGLHGDTGIFYATDPRLARTPDDAFLALDNGIEMTDDPASATSIDQLIGTGAPYFTHNAWDWDQVQAFGTTSAVAGNGGDGNTPFLYGSPVAGPQTYYLFEATDTGTAIELNDEVGPWQRIEYPGSMVGVGDCISNPGDVTCTPEASGDNTRTQVAAATATHCGATGDQPCAGEDITPANPVAANAVRFALGEARIGKAAYVEVALRVTGVPLDPNFASGAESLDCGESVGSGLSSRLSGFGGGNQPETGSQNPWPLHLPTPACVFLKLLLDVTADKELADSEQVNYTLRVRNLSLNDATNVVVRLQFQNNRMQYQVGSASIPPDNASVQTCPPPDDSKDCLTWTLGTMAPSDEIEITTSHLSGGGGNISAVMEAVYTSDQLPGGFRTQDLVVIVPIALPDLELTLPFDPTLASASSNSTQQITGTVSNEGTNEFAWDGITFNLPSGWTISGDVTIGGTPYSCIDACGTSNPTFDFNITQPAGDARALSMNVDIPPASSGLHDIGAQLWGSQTGGGFGGTFETALPELVTVNVDDVRTAKPVIDCPVASTAPSVTGTSEADADVTLYFNLMPRGVDTADGAGDWEVTDYDAFGPFGSMYGGLELRAQATAPGKLPSELSDACETTPTRECSDGFDNDGDGRIDFPADTGCDSLTDNDESDDPECADFVDNEPDGFTDWPDDPSCYGPTDETEDGAAACSDGLDNDLDGDTDFGEDADCAGDPNGLSEASLRACQNRVDDEPDTFTDFPDDPGCHSAFDDDEVDVGFTPDDLEARLLIVFDTSGSMNFNTCTDDFAGGDGSVDFPGTDISCADLTALGCDPAASPMPAAFSLCDNGVPDDSRIFQVRAGLSSVVANFGEVEWGLMRFKQRPVDFQPPTVNASLPSGGWQGGGAEPCQGFNEGELLVSFDFENAQTILDWMDGDTNYPIAPPPSLDQELRGSGTTPLAGALQSAATYVTDVKNDDPRPCRPYRVILVTDGLETCGGDPTAEAATLYDPAGLDTEVVVIGFATGDQATQDALNAIARAGSGNQRDAIFVDDQQALADAFAQIVQETLVFETCNTLDDDCDGGFDEDFIPPLGDTCTNNQLGECFRQGSFVCTSDEAGVECDAPTVTPTCADETCDGCNALDDDCDGKIDEGLTCGCLTFELCNGADDDCDGTIDEDVAGLGADCGSDVGLCDPGTVQCVDPDGDPGTANSSLDCVGATGPAPNDPCDGQDNDCDSSVDEDPGPPCYDTGDGGCTDNGMGGFDCMGTCAPGVRACTNGAPGACIGEDNAGTEVCNGADDNCNGIIDDPWAPDPNGNSPGDACDNGLLGACNASGIYTCDVTDPMAPDLVCTAPVISPSAELCNSIDDDCDDSVDEGDGTTPAPPDGLGAPIGDMCGPPGCMPGTLQCIDHDMDPGTPNAIRCVGTMGGMDEVCNALDDDCDGAIDEFIAGVGAECYPDTLAGCTPDGAGGFDCEGQCAPGATICVPPEILCDGYTGPAPVDLCNGLDDDCDGVIDEDAMCPNGTCLDGECVEECAGGEFPCGFGFFCETFPDDTCDTPPCRYCIPNPCLDIQCDPGETCIPQDGGCVDLCADVQCRAGETCENGFCFDCFDPGYDCADECEVCEADMGGVGRCVLDRCCGVDCDVGEACRVGECIGVACDPACASDERCVDGGCVPDPCDGVECPDSMTCNPDSGECEPDLCAPVTCGQGLACHPGNGMCIPDPCTHARCPDGFACVVDHSGLAQCAEPETDPGERVFAGGGGCATGGGGAGSGALLGMLLAALLLRRRRSGGG